MWIGQWSGLLPCSDGFYWLEDAEEGGKVKFQLTDDSETLTRRARG
jgi:hypothetical protein